MILNLWDILTKWTNNAHKFIMKNYEEPLFWIIIFVVLLVIAYRAISALNNK